MKEIFKQAISTLHVSEDVSLSINGTHLTAEGAYSPLFAAFSNLSTGNELATHVHFEGENGGKGKGEMDLTQEGLKLAYEAIGLKL